MVASVSFKELATWRVREEVPVEEGAYPVPDAMELEDRLARIALTTTENFERLGHPSYIRLPVARGSSIGDPG